MIFSNIKSNLEKKGYTVSCFETSKEACEYLKSEIKDKTVGIGGSMTVKEIGLYDILSENNDVVWHWVIPDGETADSMRAKARNTEIYISSANGISETGEIINIDGGCNRVAETMYGHKKVYFIVGSNKIEPDYEKALYRARNIAAPLNAKRFNLSTPCVKGGKCFDCSSPQRICRGLGVFWTKPSCFDCEIVIINEKLGF